MRLWPRSIAAQTTIVLIVGTLLVLTMGAAITVALLVSGSDLSDNTLLKITTMEGWRFGTLLGEIGPPLIVVAIGLTVLALSVAWRVSRPLRRFAAAVERLGTDIQTPLLTETGPTEIQTAARAFNITQQRIRRLLDDRNQMLAAIAHDLRTPIMRLALRAELLDDDMLRTKISSDLAEMEAMINAAIAFARAETVDEPRAMFDLANLIQAIGDELNETGQRVRVTAPAAVPYEGRQWALKRALRNLVENAAKYGGYADVALQVGPAAISVTIEDGGPGIPEAEMEQVFRPFYRVERSRNRETGGTGLGLTVARTIVRSHGGDITLANRSQGGLQQTVTLPRPENIADNSTIEPSK